MVEQNQGIGLNGLGGSLQLGKTGQSGPTAADGKDFQSMLMNSIDEVNRLQEEADQARIDLATGKTDNVAEVFTAVKKAELAFQTLMQIRNKLQDAYDEIRQMRV